MGYTSDVYVLMKEKDYIKMYNKYEKCKNRKESIEYVFDEIKMFPKTKSVLLVSKSVKWYSSFIIVKFIEDFLFNKLDEEDYKYMTLGEDGTSDDYGYYDPGDTYIYPVSYIEVENFESASDYDGFGFNEKLCINLETEDKLIIKFKGGKKNGKRK